MLGVISILLAMLKIVGLVLLGLLILLLTILLLVLFMPISYRFRVKYIAKQFEAEGEISFLFKFIRAKFAYGEKLIYNVKVAFFSILTSEKLGVETEVNEEIKETSEATVKEDEKKTNKLKTKSETEPVKEIETEKNKKSQKKKFNIFVKIEKIKEKLLAKWTAAKNTFININNKKEAVLRFINSEGTLKGVLYLLTQCKILIKMILPKKLKGWFRFGTGDVYTEGQYLSYLCFLYPLYAGKFEILPEWEEEVIEVDAVFSGKLTVFVGLLVALRILFSKNVKLLRRNFNRCKNSFAKV